MPNLNMPFVRLATEVEYVRRMREMLRTNISSLNNVVDLSRCCLLRTFSPFYVIWEVDTWG